MFWKKFKQENKKYQPKKDGWYLCTICFDTGFGHYQSYVMDLYWYSNRQKFIDNRVQNVFNTYDVMGWGNSITDSPVKKRLYHDSNCDKTEKVVAWRKLPKPYKRRNTK